MELIEARQRRKVVDLALLFLKGNKRAVRQQGEMHLPAYYSAREAYRSHQPNDPDEARNISAIISTASKKNPKWVWRGDGNS